MAKVYFWSRKYSLRKNFLALDLRLSRESKICLKWWGVASIPFPRALEHREEEIFVGKRSQNAFLCPPPPAHPQHAAQEALSWLRHIQLFPGISLSEYFPRPVRGSFLLVRLGIVYLAHRTHRGRHPSFFPKHRWELGDPQLCLADFAGKRDWTSQPPRKADCNVQLLIVKAEHFFFQEKSYFVIPWS